MIGTAGPLATAAEDAGEITQITCQSGKIVTVTRVHCIAFDKLERDAVDKIKCNH
jgi:hypothetical protein